MHKWLMMFFCLINVLMSPIMAKESLIKESLIKENMSKERMIKKIMAKEKLPGPFHFRLIKVVDGDTFHADIPVWLGLTITTKIRLEHIDTPELRGKCAYEKRLARQARDFAANWLQQDGLVLENISYGTYAGRVLATPRRANGETLGAALRAAGLARPYRGRRESWCN